MGAAAADEVSPGEVTVRAAEISYNGNMNARNIKRVMYGVLAVVAFVWAGQQYAQMGFAPPTLMVGGFGVLLAYMASTGVG